MATRNSGDAAMISWNRVVAEVAGDDHGLPVDCSKPASAYRTGAMSGDGQDIERPHGQLHQGDGQSVADEAHQGHPLPFARADADGDDA
jgi:hypothetical protein